MAELPSTVTLYEASQAAKKLHRDRYEAFFRSSNCGSKVSLMCDILQLRRSRENLAKVYLHQREQRSQLSRLNTMWGGE